MWDQLEGSRVYHHKTNTLSTIYGGETGIRTLGGLAPTTVFETAPFDHSGTSPFTETVVLVWGGLRRIAGGGKRDFRLL